MIPLPSQLSFIRTLHSSMVRSDCNKVASGEMTEAKAAERNEMMSSIVSTLERQVLIGEACEEMQAGWRERAKA